MFEAYDTTPPAAVQPAGLDWPGILAACPEAQRHHLERLASLLAQHPEVSLRLAAPGLVALVAAPAWVAAHAIEYGNAIAALHVSGAEAVRQHLLPALEALGE